MQAEIFQLLKKICRSRVNREVQIVNWEAGGEGAAETGVNRDLKRHTRRELEAKIAHKPWISEGLNREVHPQNSSVPVHSGTFHGLCTLDFDTVLSKVWW